MTALPKTVPCPVALSFCQSPHHSLSLKSYVWDAFRDEPWADDRMAGVALVWSGFVLCACRALCPSLLQPAEGAWRCGTGAPLGLTSPHLWILTLSDQLGTSFPRPGAGMESHLSGSKVVVRLTLDNVYEGTWNTITFLPKPTKALYNLPGLCKSALLVDHHTWNMFTLSTPCQPEVCSPGQAGPWWAEGTEGWEALGCE